MYLPRRCCTAKSAGAASAFYLGIPLILIEIRQRG
ncbi:hypothetical protein KP13_31883 [Klebsiella pneumoniae subsp. pneumoniae Kp13]|nr:hypothetical protein KP13_31883 [Klebsiella pneumoniae subsp. pneumoniae Kp13]